MKNPMTMFDRIWNEHVVFHDEQFPSVIYIDLHLVHEVTSPQAFSLLQKKNLVVRAPHRTIATIDHSIPTKYSDVAKNDPDAEAQIQALISNCQKYSLPLYGKGSKEQGIVHVMAPELGLTQPGMTIVCGDSHTSTHGAFGAWSFGIGTSEVAHVLATQCILQTKPKRLSVHIDGSIPFGVSSKDIVLYILSKIGIGGATEHVIEYMGSTISFMDMESRMTLCNMSIEAGARSGLIAPDDVTFNYLFGRPFAPKEEDWERAISSWKLLRSDPDVSFEKSFSFDISTLDPYITFGTDPSMGIPVTSYIPSPEDASSASEKYNLEKALNYMALQPRTPLLGHPIDTVFIGSCTNGRINDLRQAASIFRGRRVSPSVRTLVVPGSQSVKRMAESEGLDRVFLDAGAEWRNPGCSMCIAMNGDELSPGQYAVSTSNRNFEGRQGKGGRTFLASPWTAAASAIAGSIADPRPFLIEI